VSRSTVVIWARPCRWSSTRTCTFHEKGFLIQRAVVTPDQVQELLDHVDDLLSGEVEAAGRGRVGGDNTTPEARLEHLLRIHIIRRPLEIPRALHARSTHFARDCRADRAGRPRCRPMLFVKRPGSGGQRYHQDSFNIITDRTRSSVRGTPLDRADTENGYLWTSPGRQHEPVYRDVEEERAMARTGCSQTSRPSPAPMPRMSHTTDSRRRHQIRRARASGRCSIPTMFVFFNVTCSTARRRTEALSDRDGRSWRTTASPLLCPCDDKPLARGENGQRPPYTRARDYEPARPPSASLTTTWSYRARRGSPDPRATDPTGVRKPSLAYARESIPARPRAPA
jgi:hypothetical protein